MSEKQQSGKMKKEKKTNSRVLPDAENQNQQQMDEETRDHETGKAQEPKGRQTMWLCFLSPALLPPIQLFHSKDTLYRSHQLLMPPDTVDLL